jgi:hypothetical protein
METFEKIRKYEKNMGSLVNGFMHGNSLLLFLEKNIPSWVK